MALIILLLGLVPLVAVLWLLRTTWRMKAVAEAAVPPLGRFIDTPTARLHVIERGTGPAVVMIHGLGVTAGNFSYGLMDALAATHHCIAVDRPGMGWSDRAADTPANPRAQAAQIMAVLDAMEVETPLMVGHSLGGAIALCIALDHPDRIRGLALLAPLTLGGDTPSAAFAPLAIKSDLWRRIVSWTLATPMGMRSAPQVLDMVFGTDPVPADYGTAGGALLGLRPSAFYNTSRDYMASLADMKWMKAGYPGMRVPVSILYGAEDRILSPDTQGRAMTTRNPNIRLEVIAGGHMLPVTHVTASADFIRRADPGM
jgi:pimeloyl-ACP methyl ester carboxylesterase